MVITELQMGFFGKRVTDQDRDAKIFGFKDADEMRIAMTLNARQGLPHSEARMTLKFLTEAHGRPAVEAAASMLRSGEFDKRFGDRRLGECIKELEADYPDPELAALMKQMGIS